MNHEPINLAEWLERDTRRMYVELHTDVDAAFAAVKRESVVDGLISLRRPDAERILWGLATQNRTAHRQST